MATTDALVYDMSSRGGSRDPSIFTDKEFLEVIDSMNGNYNAHQSIISTDSIANSSRYQDYRNATLQIPLVYTFTGAIKPLQAASDCTYSLGLKSSLLHLIHSFSIELNGTTISQLTPYQSVWNVAKLNLSLGWNDVAVHGKTYGFCPTEANAFEYHNVTTGTASGNGTCTNVNKKDFQAVTASTTRSTGDSSFVRRQKFFNFDPDQGVSNSSAAYSTLLTKTELNRLYLNHVCNKVDCTGASGSENSDGVFQVAMMVTIPLRHLHDFFNQVPITGHHRSSRALERGVSRILPASRPSMTPHDSAPRLTPASSP